MNGRPQRRRLRVEGVVQGVGFRPFVFNLAERLQLAGYAANTGDGVIIEIQGHPARLDDFAHLLRAQAPPLAQITAVTQDDVEPEPGARGFAIRASARGEGPATLIPPDVAICPACLAEIRDPRNRRFGYPFTNCTDCGPRWTIIKDLPYDRPATTMAKFAMCPQCRREYGDPRDRRFHAQPNACPVCGPQVSLVDGAGRPLVRADGAQPLPAAADLLAAGGILAVKGLGGFHLAVRADDEEAVLRLRRRKGREAKPLAVMVRDLEAAAALAVVSDAQRALLQSPAAPIVLCEKSPSSAVADAVAPGHRTLGLMLPYTPLHHLLLDRLAEHDVGALVMTSGNLGGEPICLDGREAAERLAGIADGWLVHDREILRRADDSVAQVLADGPQLLRRSRGYAPVPIFVPATAGAPDVLAVGPELKSTVCLLQGERGFLSPHVGDLESLESCAFLLETAECLQSLLRCRPRVIAHDLHPGYFSTRWAQKLAAEDPALTLVGVQHHHAHLTAVLAELQVPGPALGLILDGTGYGTDGTIWGGELLAGDASGFTRLAHLEPVPLPGGDAAIRSPWRIAVAYLRHAFGSDPASWPDLPFLEDHPVDAVLQMLDAGVGSPLTSSCGRLFDAVAALTGLWPHAHYEAQAAIELTSLTTPREAAAARSLAEAPEAAVAAAGAVAGAGAGPFTIPVAPLVREAARALAAGCSAATLSARFHRTLIDTFTAAALQGAGRTGLDQVVLAGGVFQNAILADGLREALAQAGLRPLRPRLLPPNDGAIALGQAVVARAECGKG